MENLTVLSFNNPTQAFQLQEALLKLQGESLFNLSDAVVITRDDAGKVKLHQSLGAAVGGSAAAGSVAGLILGAIFMNPWVGSAVGSGVGAIAGALTDLGIDDRFMKELGANIKPGNSALAILGSKLQLDAFAERVGPLLKGVTLLQTTVDTKREAEIRKLLEGQ